MANIFNPKSRHVVPSFRRFADAAALGELSAATSDSPQPVPVDFDAVVAEWKHGQTVGIAADLLSRAIVSGRTLPQISEAADFVLTQGALSSPSLVSAANRLLGNARRVGGTVDQLPRLSSFLQTHSRERIYRRIRELRQATTRFPEDPIVFAELARLYLIIGNSAKAKKNMQVALALAPGNRFVLRSAARMYAHYDESERAYDLLRKNVGTRYDPWLMSAELAMAGLIGQQSRVAKSAAALASSTALSPFSLAELSSELGSVELLEGSRRRSKQLFKAALTQPNGNALAQIEWALSIDKLFDVDLKSFDVSRNYEAMALEAFNAQRWTDVIEHCESWFMDMPFASRPIMMASHVASVVLDDYASAQMFCQAGLVAHPHNPSLINNYAYALALDGKPDEALAVLDQVPLSSVHEPSTRACLVATKGLAYFRKGRINEGRILYLEAAETARKAENVMFRHLALLNYTREELLARQPLAPSVIEAVRRLKIDAKAVTLRILRDKVVAQLEATSATDPKPA